jgi:CheY-like chemotaxis protein
MPGKKGCTVLIAEDEEADLFLLRRALKEASGALPVYSVTDGGEVIAYLSGTGAYADRTIFPLPELLLLDLKLPRKSGFEILEWLRAHPVFRRLPAVVLTSSELITDVDKAYSLGASGYFVKKTDPVEFQQQVRVISAYWCAAAERPVIAR